MKFIKTLPILAICALTACSSSPPRVTDLPTGHYESTSTSTSAAGTTTDRAKSTDVYYDADGRKTATVNTTTTSDPPGLLNKSTTQTSQTVH